MSAFGCNEQTERELKVLRAENTELRRLIRDVAIPAIDEPEVISGSLVTKRRDALTKLQEKVK